jgi:hypothetical protein
MLCASGACLLPGCCWKEAATLILGTGIRPNEAYRPRWEFVGKLLGYTWAAGAALADQEQADARRGRAGACIAPTLEIEKPLKQKIFS